MPEYQLYCFAQSGNAYRAALMLNLIGADWQPVYVDFFKGGETRTPKYRAEVNEMGEVPVLAHGTKKLSQSSGDSHLPRRTRRPFQTGWRKMRGSKHYVGSFSTIRKWNGFLGPYRFLKNFARPAGDPAVLAFLKGRIDGNLGDRRSSGLRKRRSCWAINRPSSISRSQAISTIRRKSSASISRREFKNIGAWRDRMQALPGWAHPYDLMPGHPPKL